MDNRNEALPEESVIKYNKLKVALFIPFGIAFLAAFTAMWADPSYFITSRYHNVGFIQIIGSIGTILFSAGMIAMFIKLFDSTPFLTINRFGVRCNLVTPRQIPWSEIQGFEIVEINVKQSTLRYLVFRVTNPEKYAKIASNSVRRVINLFTRILASKRLEGQLTAAISMVNISHNEILELCNKYHERYKEAEPVYHAHVENAQADICDQSDQAMTLRSIIQSSFLDDYVQKRNETYRSKWTQIIDKAEKRYPNLSDVLITDNKTINNVIFGAHSWNWAAFFFNVLWLFYRKMYVYGFIGVISLLIIGEILDATGQNVSIGGLAIGYALGLMGNNIYLYKMISNIRQQSQRSQSDLEQYLIEFGGVNWWACLLAFFVYFAAALGLTFGPQLVRLSSNVSPETVATVSVPAPSVTVSPPQPQPTQTPATRQPEQPPLARVPDTKYQEALAAYNKGDYQTAFQLMQPLAEQGLADAQFKLGKMYVDELGVTRNIAEGIKWLTKAAEQGDAKSQAKLGIMYAEGDGVRQDFAVASAWYSKAAENGNPIAQNNLATMYQDGQGVSQNTELALMWYRKAADQGYVAAQTNLGLIYRIGKLVTQDNAEAAKWLSMAANQGHPQSQTILAIMSEKGEGVPQNYDIAATLYRKAANQGFAPAQTHLGIMYMEGRSVSKDVGEALKWFSKAAEQGNVDGAKNLNRLFDEQNDVATTAYNKGDYDTALRILHPLAERGSSVAQHSLAFMCEKGYGVPKDLSEAAKWMRKSADQGNVDSQFDLGVFYERGWGVQKDIVQASGWYKKAADQGDQEAKASLQRLKAGGAATKQ